MSGCNITAVPPPHLTDNPSSSPRPRVGLRYKNRRIRQRRHVLPRETHTSTAAAARLRILTFSLMNSQMILVISSPSISTTGWDTLMRLSASVVHTHTRTHTHRDEGSIKGSFPFTARRSFVCGSTRLPGSTRNTNSTITQRSGFNLQRAIKCVTASSPFLQVVLGDTSSRMTALKSQSLDVLVSAALFTQHLEMQ